MKWFTWRCRDRDRALNDELQGHLEMSIRDRVARGESLADATAASRREFGNLGTVQETTRSTWSWSWVEPFLQDLRHALRSLRRAPGLTATIVVTLALGVGVNAAVFSFLDRLLLRPPDGVSRPGEIRRLYAEHLGRAPRSQVSARFSYPGYVAIDSALRSRAGVAAYGDARAIPIECSGAPSVARAMYTTANLFPLLGVRPALGRLFTPEEARPDAGLNVAVISDRLWRRAFARDSAILGREICADSARLVIVGVTPPDFAGFDVSTVDLWIPFGVIRSRDYQNRALAESPNESLQLIARLGAGVSAAALDAPATAAYRRSAAGGRPQDTTLSVLTGPILEAMGPAAERQEISIAARLGGVAVLILLITCTNVATLLLIRATVREREIAVRLALGISRLRLHAHLITESVLLAVIAGAAAVLFGAWGGVALRRALLPDVQWAGAAMDVRIAMVTLALALVAGLVAGIAPALQVTRPQLTNALKGGTQSGGFRRSRLRSWLVGAQAALSLVLLVGAALFVRSLLSVEAIDVGYSVERIAVASVSAPKELQREAGRVLAEEVERLHRVPGVESVALDEKPMGVGIRKLSVPNRDSVPRLNGIPPLETTGGTAEYFATTGIRLLAGRGFTPSDGDVDASAMIVNQSMARTLWPGESAVGKCVLLSQHAAQCTPVVGVVSDSHLDRLIQKPVMLYYLPLTHDTAYPPQSIIIRADPKRRAAVEAITRADLKERLSPLAAVRVDDFEAAFAAELRPWRIGAALFTALGALALIVSTLGVYSVIAYSLAQRTHEMGVRIALGARAADVLRLVASEGLRVVAVGAGVGVLLALALGRFVESQLYGVSAHDPVAMGMAAFVLLAAGVLAAMAPARRAARVDPIIALRHE